MRAFIRRAWKSRQLEQDEISRHACCPGSQTSRSNVRAAPNPVSPAHSTTRRNVRSSARRTASAQAVMRSCSAALASGATIETSSTLRNWCWRSIPRVSRPAAPASLR